MKKPLLSVSALALLSALAMPEVKAETKPEARKETEAKKATKPEANGFVLSLGGYYDSMFYSVDTDAVTNASGVVTNAIDGQLQEDAEIYFNGKVKNDDYEYGFQIQLEARSTTDDQIDEHYIYVKTPFGKVEIGAENSAAYKSQAHAPKFLGWETYDNNFDTWAAVSDYAAPDHANISDDANKLNYYSPRVNGVQAVFAYTPSTENAKGGGLDLGTKLAGKYKVISYGANYKGAVGGGRLQLSYTAEDGDDLNGTNTAEDQAIGANYKRGDFELGGTFYESERPETAEPAKITETEILHVGVGYKLSPSTTLGFAFHDQEKSTDGGVASETDIIILGGNTKLIKGVRLTYSFEEVASTKPTQSKQDSTFIGAGLLFRF